MDKVTKNQVKFLPKSNRDFGLHANWSLKNKKGNIFSNDNNPGSIIRILFWQLSIKMDVTLNLFQGLNRLKDADAESRDSRTIRLGIKQIRVTFL